MAKQKKTPSAKADGAEQQVLDYLRKQNRPYSATDIVNNLHGAITKTIAQKALNTLAEKGDVTHKPYGKQSVYVINQNQFELPSSDDLASMDAKINTLKTEIMEYAEKNKQLQLGVYSYQFSHWRVRLLPLWGRVLNGLNNSLTNKQIKERLKTLEDENGRNEERLNILRSGTKQVSNDDRKRIDASYEMNRKFWKQRKKLFDDIFKTLMEYIPQKPQEFTEEIGIEEDPIDINEDPLANI
ncbi:10052_t:CDS:2 [Paraglomus brasilianum]|uniref:10052_t:CDS:1 n=1 Tax=Paraglomus brasilianum TaxID=144538 RepID=A0A9N9F6X1_9GLOM|nr:10052_t:CDS:2 [Paraglomus brasilianum]